MELADVFENHIKLAVRLAAGKPLNAQNDLKRSATSNLPTAAAFRLELADLELPNTEFDLAREQYEETDFTDALYAADALIDSVASRKFGDWIARNSDTDVGHNFYEKLRVIYRSRRPKRSELLELYVLCALVGFREEKHKDDYESVKDAFDEVIRASRSIRFAVHWEPTPVLSSYDPQLKRSHELVRILLITTAISYPILLAVFYSVVWAGFVRP